MLVITSSRDDAMKNNAGLALPPFMYASTACCSKRSLATSMSDWRISERLGRSLLPVEDVLDLNRGGLIRVGGDLEFGLGGQIGLVGAGRGRAGAIDLGLGDTKGWTGGGQGSHQNQDHQQRHPPARESAGHRQSGY